MPFKVRILTVTTEDQPTEYATPEQAAAVGAAWCDEHQVGENPAYSYEVIEVEAE